MSLLKPTPCSLKPSSLSPTSPLSPTAAHSWQLGASGSLCLGLSWPVCLSPAARPQQQTPRGHFTSTKAHPELSVPPSPRPHTAHLLLTSPSLEQPYHLSPEPPMPPPGATCDHPISSWAVLASKPAFKLSPYFPCCSFLGSGLNTFGLDDSIGP